MILSEVEGLEREAVSHARLLTSSSPLALTTRDTHCPNDTRHYSLPDVAAVAVEEMRQVLLLAQRPRQEGEHSEEAEFTVEGATVRVPWARDELRQPELSRQLLDLPVW